MSSSEIKNQTEIMETKGRWIIFIKLFSVVAFLGIISEIIGTKSFKVGPGKVVLLPMIFALIIGIAMTPDALGKKIKQLRNIISDDEIELAGSVVMIALLPLGVKYGTLVGPNLVKIIEAGPALIFQELGNLGTLIIGLPIAMLLGLKRVAVGATVSICREPTLGVIGEKYGLNSPEGTGVLGTYMVGNIFGTIFFGLLGSFGVLTGLHPYALAMACGIGSGSMMTASSASLAATVPEMADTILAYAATSNMLTGVTGLYVVVFISLPLANFMYKKLEPMFYKNK